MIRAYPSLDANLERIAPLLSTRSLERGHRRISFLLDDRSRARLIALIEFEATKLTHMCIYIFFNLFPSEIRSLSFFKILPLLESSIR